METIKQFTKDIAYISKLGDSPNSDDGLTSAGLKAKFDQAGQDIQAWLNELVDTINANNYEIGSAVNANAVSMSGIVRRYIVTIPATWAGGAPFYQEIEVLGLLETDTPIVDLILSDDYITSQEEAADYGNIYRIIASADKITVYATVKTSVDLTIQMLVNRNPSANTI